MDGKDGAGNDLRMFPEEMLALARQTAELLVRRLEKVLGRESSGEILRIN